MLEQRRRPHFRAKHLLTNIPFGDLLRLSAVLSYLYATRTTIVIPFTHNPPCTQYTRPQPQPLLTSQSSSKSGHRISISICANLRARYWGKRDTKLILPTNSSLSVTLDQTHLKSTTTSRADPSFEHDQLWLNGKLDEIKLGGRLATCIAEMKRLRKETVEDKSPNEPKASSIPSLILIYSLTSLSVINIQSAHRVVQQLSHCRRSCIVRIRIRSSRRIFGAPICSFRLSLSPLSHRSPRFRFRLSIPLRRFRCMAKG